MRDLTGLFSYPGTPCDDARIAEIEHTLGRQLPEAYRELIKQTGGGVLSARTCVFPGEYAPDSYPGGVIIFPIYGNGKNGNGTANNLDELAPYMTDEWELPEEVLLFAESEGGMHECFAINYELPQFPPLSILYLDTDPDGRIVQVADSFEDFINGLTSDPEEDEDQEDDYGNTYLEGVRRGSLAPDLIRALEKAPAPGTEKLVRSAAEPIAEDRFFLKNNDEGRAFLDVFFWLLSNYRPVKSVGDFSGWGTEETEPNFKTMTVESFRGRKNRAGVMYSLIVFKLWWKDRVARGLLTDTGNGFRLDETHMNTVIDQLLRGTTATETAQQTASDIGKKRW